MIGHLRPRSVAAVALAIGLGATLWAWFIAGRQVEREGRAKFEQQASLAAGLLERRIQRYIDVLYGLEALAYHDQTLTRAEFGRYVSALELGKRFPGVQAVQLVRRVTDEERDEFVRRTRASG